MRHLKGEHGRSRGSPCVPALPLYGCPQGPISEDLSLQVYSAGWRPGLPDRPVRSLQLPQPGLQAPFLPPGFPASLQAFALFCVLLSDLPELHGCGLQLRVWGGDGQGCLCLPGQLNSRPMRPFAAAARCPQLAGSLGQPGGPGPGGGEALGGSRVPDAQEAEASGVPSGAPTVCSPAGMFSVRFVTFTQ